MKEGASEEESPGGRIHTLPTHLMMVCMVLANSMKTSE